MPLVTCKFCGEQITPPGLNSFTVCWKCSHRNYHEGEKSVLDGLPVDDKAFPLLHKPQQSQESFEQPVSVVGQCPTCANPIYGKQFLEKGEDPCIRRTCKCHEWLGKRRTT